MCEVHTIDAISNKAFKELKSGWHSSIFHFSLSIVLSGRVYRLSYLFTVVLSETWTIQSSSNLLCLRFNCDRYLILETDLEAEICTCWGKKKDDETVNLLLCVLSAAVHTTGNYRCYKSSKALQTRALLSQASLKPWDGANLIHLGAHCAEDAITRFGAGVAYTPQQTWFSQCG